MIRVLGCFPKPKLASFLCLDTVYLVAGVEWRGGQRICRHWQSVARSIAGWCRSAMVRQGPQGLLLEWPQVLVKGEVRGVMERALNGPQRVQPFLPKEKQCTLRTLAVPWAFLSKLSVTSSQSLSSMP